MAEESKGIILLADDNDVARNISQEIIRRNFPGFSLEVFPNGISLVERLERGVDDVRLIITDNEMPGVDGSEIIRQYARRLGYEKIPFILRYGGEEQIGIKSIEDGAFAYACKQLGNNVFRDVVRRALDFIGSSQQLHHQ